MLTKIKTLIITLTALLMFSAPAVVMAEPTIANPNANTTNSLCGSVNNLQILPDPETGRCTTAGTEGDSKVNSLIKQVINIFSVIIGVVAVIMIIVGGFRYITSAGGSDKVKNAKNTILYALIGLVIVALAQVVVKYVLTKATA